MISKDIICYIKHYMDNYSDGAIMLTGDWGTGKSFFYKK